jgi:hypothetical protein
VVAALTAACLPAFTTIFARPGRRFLRFVALRWSRKNRNFNLRSKRYDTRQLQATRRKTMNTMNKKRAPGKDNTLMSTILAAGLLMVLAAPLLSADDAMDHATSHAVMDTARRATEAVMPGALRTTVEQQPAIIVSAPRLVRNA